MTGDAWATVTTVCITVLTVVGGAVWQSRRAREGDDRTYQLQADAGIASGYSLLTSDLREEITRKEVERREELDRMHGEIKKLRTDVDEVKHRYRNALAYIRLLRAFITDNVAQAMPPPIPDDLTLDID